MSMFPSKNTAFRAEKMPPSSTDMRMFICASHIGYQPKIQPFRAEKIVPSSTANPAIGWCVCVVNMQNTTSDNCL